MQETLYQTANAGVSYRQRMLVSFYQTADAGVYQTADSGDTLSGS